MFGAKQDYLLVNLLLGLPENFKDQLCCMFVRQRNLITTNGWLETLITSVRKSETEKVNDWKRQKRPQAIWPTIGVKLDWFSTTWLNSSWYWLLGSNLTQFGLVLTKFQSIPTCTNQYSIRFNHISWYITCTGRYLSK